MCWILVDTSEGHYATGDVTSCCWGEQLQYVCFWLMDGLLTCFVLPKEVVSYVNHAAEGAWALSLVGAGACAVCDRDGLHVC